MREGPSQDKHAGSGSFVDFHQLVLPATLLEESSVHLTTAFSEAFDPPIEEELSGVNRNCWLPPRLMGIRGEKILVHMTGHFPFHTATAMATR